MRKMLLLLFVILTAISWNDGKEIDAGLTYNNFVGVWENENDETRSFPKCEIRYEENRFYVHIWGACVPQYCDWGETPSEKLDENTTKFVVNWDQGFVKRTQILELKEGKLILTTNSHYKDDSGRPDSSIVDTFTKK